MTKDELIEMLEILEIPLNEGVSSVANTNVYPRIDFWDYVWGNVQASETAYMNLDTYQISFYAKQPKHEKLVELRKLLRSNGINTDIYHEFVAEDRVWHSYFSIEVLCDLD